MSRKAYTGTSRKLLLAFDVGTTFSGISYSIMDPGQVPEIRPVTRYPGQGHVGADCKIPTEIYYDSNGSVRAIGAEASRDDMDDRAEDEGWTKARWFKLHMRPRGQRNNLFFPPIPPLPRGKSVVRLFADFFRYLFDCAKNYIQETHAGGALLWSSVSDNIFFVFTHPNGWEGPQQAQMRQAAIWGGLVADNASANLRITFVTEGEASLHFCINNGLAPGAVERGDGIIIVDAGGGTIDVSAYRGQNGAFYESAIPQCHFQGSVFVRTRAETHLKALLRDTRFEEDIDRIGQLFDQGAKLSFKDDADPHFVRFGPSREHEPSLGIRNGQLKLAGTTVARFFEPSIACIIKAVKDQMAESQYPISHVFLVGGFAASDWLYSSVKRGLPSVEVSRPDTHVNKAVSDGAAAFYLDHFVEARVSRACFGVCTFVDFNPAKDDHFTRQHKLETHPVTKNEGFGGFYSVILPKNEPVSEVKEHRSSFSRAYSSSSNSNHSSFPFSCNILRYAGEETRTPINLWIDDNPERFTTACIIRADINSVSKTFCFGKEGYYYNLKFDIILLFGLTELKAQVAWMENGVEKRGPAEVLYGDE